VTTRIVIADDQAMIRDGFRLVLDAQPDMQVVGEAADGEAALAQAQRLTPDVLLADIRMPRLDGLEVTRRLAAEGTTAGIRVVIVTTFDLDEYVHAALRHGAAGFLLKRAGPALLVEAVRAAVAGDALISPSITVRLLRRLGHGGAADADRGPSEALTAREIDVARLVAAGKTNAEIAADLVISRGTVKTHVANIQRKLAVTNRVGIAAWAWQYGHAEP
jgi:DNA-binding NarL/FixJ family response regulator